MQLYAADTATGVTLPAQQLVGFARVDLEPGASKTVAFVVPMSLLAYTGLSGELVMEPGPVEVSAGTPTQAMLCLIDLKVVRLTHDPRHLDSITDIAGYAGCLAEVLSDA